MPRALDDLLEASSDDDDTSMRAQDQAIIKVSDDDPSSYQASFSESSSEEESEDAASPFVEWHGNVYWLHCAIMNKESKGRFAPRSIRNTYKNWSRK